MSLETEIRTFFDEYEATWNSRRFGALAELWDRDDPSPFYRPMEVDGYITSWKDLERYWEPKPGTSYIDDLRFHFVNLKPKLVAPDVAVVMTDLVWDLKLKGGEYAKPMSGKDPVIIRTAMDSRQERIVYVLNACAAAKVTNLTFS